MEPEPRILRERDMEDVIAAHPDSVLGEPGLRLLSRQPTIGPYRFDLLLADRHGHQLIVELQRGTLDRTHTYKVLDYYHEYKERHPHVFVDLMVVANEITAERKQRLQQLGVEFREIPVASFLEHLVLLPQPSTAPPAVAVVPEPEVAVESEDRDLRSLKRLFLHVTREFRQRVGEIDGAARFSMIQSLPDDGHNWFITWVPGGWGRPVKGFGIHWGLTCGQSAKRPSGHFRLVLGCERPLLAEHKQAFMAAITSHARRTGSPLHSFTLVDVAPKQRKLAASEALPLQLDAGAQAFELYASIQWFNDLVRRTMIEWNGAGRFVPPLRYD